MASSTLKKLEQGYDNETEEHVIRLEYRIKIGDALPSKPNSRMLEDKRATRIAYLTELAARMNKNAAREAGAAGQALRPTCRSRP
jgi:hypothetical protein